MNYLCAALRGTALHVRLLRLAASLGVFVLASALSLRAADAGSGTLAGSITSAKTHNALQGATISIPSLRKMEISDNSGNFVLQNIPAGQFEVVVSYSGFEDSRQTVSVRPGATSQIDAVLRPSQAVIMDAFTVASEREGQALSITEQRNASNIKNVSALDEWGNLPTMNVGELVMRMPGVTFTVDGDDNLVNNVSIRGVGAQYTRLNVDGMASTGVGDGRTATLYSFSGAMYEEIEIVAGQTPDKRADGLGGQLNLKTRSALSMSEKRRTNYNLSFRWAPPFSDRNTAQAKHALHPAVSVNYQERFDVFGGNRNLGIAVNASYAETVAQISYDQFFYQSTTDPVAFFNDYTTWDGLNHRFVTGLSVRTDYRPNPRTLLSARFLYNAGSEPYYDRVKIDPIGNSTIATRAADGTLSGTGSVVPGFTANRTEIRPTGVLGNSRMDLEMFRVSFVSQNPTYTVTGEHDLGQLKFDWALRWSQTRFDSGAGRQRQVGALTMRDDNIGFVLDKTNPGDRVFTQTAGPSVYDPASYTTNIVYTKRDLVNRNADGSGNANATYTLATEVPVVLKAGVDAIHKRITARQPNTRRWNRAANPNGPAGTLIPLSGFPTMTMTRFEENNGGKIPTFDPASVNAELSNTSLWTEDLQFAAQQPYVSRRIINEAVDAAYVQGSTRLFNRLSVLGGVRREDVDVDTFTYVKYRSTPAGVPASSSPDVLLADFVRRAQADYGPSTSEGKYHNYFPSLHLAYDLTRNLKARASWSKSYGRPNTGQLLPTVTFNDATRTVTAGNPALRPQMAKNIDLKLEYYFSNSGVATIAYFQKKIKDYIATSVIGKVPTGPDNGFDGNFAGYDYTASTNVGDADVNGWEADFRKTLTFLPGLLKGITVAANYTWLDTKGKFSGVTELKRNQVVGFIPRAANVRLLYNYRKFGASASANFTGEHILSYSATAPANNFYRRDLTIVTFGASYKFDPRATFFVDVNNLFQKGTDQYRFIPSRPRQIVHAARTINFGINGQF